jgi:hypothetical protein
MTEEKNPQTPTAGILLFLGKRQPQKRASHIPTAPAAAVRLIQNPNPKGASSTTARLFSRLILRLEKTNRSLMPRCKIEWPRSLGAT